MMTKNDFPTTNWSVINLASNDDAPTFSDALNQLMVIYLPALTSHLIYDWRIPKQQAEDYVHGFVADKVIRDELIKKANRDRGRFRHFLLTALDNHVISIMRKDKAKRRSPGDDAFVSLDEIDLDALGAPDTGTAFEVSWANSVIMETLRRVKDACEASGRSTFWEIFNNRIVLPHLTGQPPDKYEHLVRKTGFTTPIQASNALLTVKRMFARTFRDVVKEYVANESLVDSEIQELKGLMNQYGLNHKRGKNARSDEP